MGTTTSPAKVRRASGIGARSGTAPATIPDSTNPVNMRAPSGAFHMNSTVPAPQATPIVVVAAKYRRRHLTAAAASGPVARNRRASR